VTVHWGIDEWADVRDTDSLDTGLGVWVADLDTAAKPAGCHMVFTLYWHDTARWDDVVYRVSCVERV
jgi:hypothetical protein